MPYFIHKHEISLEYGGPEEGGWHYESGTPVEEFPCYYFTDEKAAYDCCRVRNQQEAERAAKEEDYPFHSVLAHRSTHYSYSVKEFWPPVAYPECRPHYE